MGKQLDFGFKTHRRRAWGGRRRGAGRPCTDPRGRVGHGKREPLSGREPVHATWRIREHLPSLRTSLAATVVLRALRAASAGPHFRVVHHSLQGDHVHLVVEASSREALSSAMQGLGVRIARGLNRAFRRKGTVFADRFHAHVLRALLEVRNAVSYVVHNFRRHAERRVGKANAPPGWWVDPYSSRATPLAAPETWLLRRIASEV